MNDDGLDDAENMDWMMPSASAQDPTKKPSGTAPTLMPPVSVPATHGSGAAWKSWSWCTPMPFARLMLAQVAAAKKECEHHSALALSYAKQASTEKEEAACIAARAKAQTQLSAMNSVLRKQGKRPKSADEMELNMSHEPAKIVMPTAETAQSDAGAVEGPELPPGKKRRAARGEAGTFAGNRPPSSSDGKELFEYKKVLYSETREELQKKFPGKEIQVGKTATQHKYWEHVRQHLKKALPNCDCKLPEKRPSKADVRAELKKASDSWKKHLRVTLSKPAKHAGK